MPALDHRPRARYRRARQPQLACSSLPSHLESGRSAELLANETCWAGRRIWPRCSPMQARQKEKQTTSCSFQRMTLRPLAWMESWTWEISGSGSSAGARLSLGCLSEAGSIWPPWQDPEDYAAKQAASRGQAASQGACDEEGYVLRPIRLDSLCRGT